MKIFFITLFFFLVISVSHVSAQGFCDLFPCEEYEEGAVSGTMQTVENLVLFFLGSIFLFIIVIGIYQVIKASLKIIRSSGDSGKIEEGSKQIKGVFLGLVILVVGIIGMIILIVFFQASDLFSVNVEKPRNVEIPFL